MTHIFKNKITFPNTHSQKCSPYSIGFFGEVVAFPLTVKTRFLPWKAVLKWIFQNYICGTRGQLLKPFNTQRSANVDTCLFVKVKWSNSSFFLWKTTTMWYKYIDSHYSSQNVHRHHSIWKAVIFWNKWSDTVLGYLVCNWLELLCSSIACSIICLQMTQQKNFIYVTIDDSESRFLFQIICLIISTEDWLLVRFHEITLIQMGTPVRCPPTSLLSFFLIAEIPFEHTWLPKAGTTFSRPTSAL